MLHLVFQSPIGDAILERIAADDDVIFIENAVLGLLQKGKLSETLVRLLGGTRLFVLSDDIAARGISPNELVSGIEVIDYNEFVSLTVKCRVIQSWS
jgi:tRNA 2-thiouridine synthesizing protein B